MRIALCDDERFVLNELDRLIMDYAAHMDYDVRCDTYTSGQKLLNSGEKYDLYILDYRMDGMDGLELSKRILEQYSDALIGYLTGEPGIVCRAINEVSARPFCFFTKPIVAEELHKKLDEWFRSFVRFQKIPLRRGGETVLLNARDILYIQPQDGGSIVCMADRTEEFPYLLKDIEVMLPKEIFVQTHRFFIVNMMHIVRRNDRILTLDNGEKVEIGRRRVDDFIKAYQTYNLLGF